MPAAATDPKDIDKRVSSSLSPLSSEDKAPKKAPKAQKRPLTLSLVKKTAAGIEKANRLHLVEQDHPTCTSYRDLEKSRTLLLGLRLEALDLPLQNEVEVLLVAYEKSHSALRSITQANLDTQEWAKHKAAELLNHEVAEENGKFIASFAKRKDLTPPIESKTSVPAKKQRRKNNGKGGQVEEEAPGPAGVSKTAESNTAVAAPQRCALPSKESAKPKVIPASPLMDMEETATPVTPLPMTDSLTTPTAPEREQSAPSVETPVLFIEPGAPSIETPVDTPVLPVKPATSSVTGAPSIRTPAVPIKPRAPSSEPLVKEELVPLQIPTNPSVQHSYEPGRASSPIFVGSSLPLPAYADVSTLVEPSTSPKAPGHFANLLQRSKPCSKRTDPDNDFIVEEKETVDEEDEFKPEENEISSGEESGDRDEEGEKEGPRLSDIEEQFDNVWDSDNGGWSGIHTGSDDEEEKPIIDNELDVANPIIISEDEARAIEEDAKFVETKPKRGVTVLEQVQKCWDTGVSLTNKPMDTKAIEKTLDKDLITFVAKPSLHVSSKTCRGEGASTPSAGYANAKITGLSGPRAMKNSQADKVTQAPGYLNCGCDEDPALLEVILWKEGSLKATLCKDNWTEKEVKDGMPMKLLFKDVEEGWGNMIVDP
ncbi:hypothetical protein C8J56DRAFT_1054276 [Mycena floridula]|nr:hypothetical protein C8J56DRAFT_1054276 [Mycena floridula]